MVYQSSARTFETRQLVEHFQSSQFVAKSKILKITPDSKNNKFLDADIELITLYKGKRLKKIKIRTENMGICGFLPSVNSTWIIFSSDTEGHPSLDPCSGSKSLDMKCVID